MQHNKVMNVGAVISLASPEAAGLSPSKPSISQLASLLAAPWTQTVQSFLSRKIAPTKNVSIFLWTIPGIPGTSRRDKKTCAHSIEMCVHVVGKPPKGCVCTQWNSGVRETATHQHGGHWGQARFCRAHLSSTPSTWHKRPVQWRQVHPFHPNQFPWILSVPLFLVIKVPGITALWNSGKPPRQQLIFFKDV